MHATPWRITLARFSRLGLGPPLPPMEAKLVDTLPLEEGWQFEPKWDGFRCLVFRDGAEVELQSKAGRPLGRHFPEVETLVRAPEQCRMDQLRSEADPARANSLPGASPPKRR